MADLRKYIQAQKFTLASGISTTDSSIILTSFAFPDGTAIAAGDIGSINYGTLEPGTARAEQISFTGLTINGDGTTTLTGVTRGLGFGAVDTYSEQTNLKIQHGAGSVFIISNTAAFYNDFVNKLNDETMTGYLSGPTPTSGAHYATKDYADSLTTATSLSYDRVVIAATAGESLAEGDLVYFDDTDNEWKRCAADTAATINNVLLGTAQGAGTNGNPIAGGVLIYGLDPKNTGYTAGVKLYAGNTAGDIVTTSGTIERCIGFANGSGQLIFDSTFSIIPSSGEKAAMAGGGDFGTPSTSNKFITQDYNSSSTGIPTITTFTASGTWTKPAGLKYVIVEGVGSGGGGEASSGSNGSGGSGGGGGGYFKKKIAAASLGATETVTIGAAGTGGSGSGNDGTAGGNTTFGAHATANGGGAGSSNAVVAGGTATGGDINIQGGSTNDVTGGDSFYGYGGLLVSNSSSQGTGYGSGGSGGYTSSGSTPRGGASGAAGIVIVTEYYS